MMGISRDLVDLAKTGHTCTFVIGVKASQGSVFANRIPILRPGDPCLPHFIQVCCPLRCIPHLAVVNMGSPTVFVKNVPVARRLDSTDRKMLIMGSPNVYANGSG